MAQRRLRARDDAQLRHPVLRDSERSQHARVREVVERVRHGVAVHVVVGGQLRLDVRHRDEAPDAHHQPFRDLREERFAVEHREVHAVGLVLAQQLVAQQPVGRGVAVVRAVDGGDAHAPVHVVLLDGIGQAFQVDDGLVELRRVGRVVVRGRRVAARLRLAGAEVGAGVHPAVDLQVVVAHPLAEGGIGQRGHQGAVDRRGTRDAERRRAAVRPLGEGHGGRRLRGGREIVATRRRCLRIGRLGALAPFERVVVPETLEEAGAEGRVEAVVVLVGVAGRGHGLGVRRVGGVGRDGREERGDRGADGGARQRGAAAQESSDGSFFHVLSFVGERCTGADPCVHFVPVVARTALAAAEAAASLARGLRWTSSAAWRRAMTSRLALSCAIIWPASRAAHEGAAATMQEASRRVFARTPAFEGIDLLMRSMGSFSFISADRGKCLRGRASLVASLEIRSQAGFWCKQNSIRAPIKKWRNSMRHA